LCGEFPVDPLKALIFVVRVVESMCVMIWDLKVSKEEWRAWRARKQAKNLYSATRVFILPHEVYFFCINETTQ
jgi:hypothetical protein